MKWNKIIFFKILKCLVFYFYMEPRLKWNMAAAGGWNSLK